MTAVAVEQYRPAMDSCMVGMRLCGCIGLARLRRRTLVIRESIGGWRMVNFNRMLNVDRKYRKCESKYEKVTI